MIRKNGKIKLTNDEAAAMLRLSVQQFFKVRDLAEFSTEPHPEDGRRVVNDYEDVLEAAKELGDGREYRGYKFRSRKDLQDGKVRAIMVEADSAGQNVGFLRMMLETQSGGPGEVERVVAKSEDLNQSVFDREVEHVRDKCFGFADETETECTQNCNIFSACAEKRNEILDGIAEAVEEREADAEVEADIHKSIEELEELEKENSEVFSDWNS